MNSSDNIEETPFGYDELFYSKTDKRGLIQAGNPVFQRVSGFSWQELIGHPHNVVRHPDMPRGVFHLLWEFLKRDEPIGAFVKNRSKDGRHYWVLALALPVTDGYLSVRLKPGGDLLRVIESQYAELRTEERLEKLSPDESHRRLLGRLKVLGFADYGKFMSFALADQMRNRAVELKQAPPQAIQIISDLASSSALVTQETGKILDRFHKSRYVPLNLEIQAAQSGHTADQIAVVAARYQKMMEEISGEVGRFGEMSKTVEERAERSRFLVGAHELLKEVRGSTEPDALSQIEGLARGYLKSSVQALRQVADVIYDFISICTSLRSFSAGLEVVRLTGKIESSRLENGRGITTVLEDLKEFQIALASGIKEILERNASMSHATAILSKNLRSMGE